MKNSIIKRMIALLISFLLNCPIFSYGMNIKVIEPKNLQETLNSDSRVKFLFIFTSWCGACKRSFSKVLEMQKRYQDNKDLEILMLSLDESLPQLEKLAQKYDDHNSYIYFFDHQADKKDVVKALYENGIKYRGSIPHTTIFLDNDIVADSNYDINSVERFVEHILDSKDSAKQ